MVPVGDERAAPGEVGFDGRLRVRVGQRPQPVRHAVLGDRDGERRPAVRDLVHYARGGPGGAPVPAGARPLGLASTSQAIPVGLADTAPTVIDEQNGLKVAPGRLHQFPPPGDGPRHDALVRQHRARAHPDEPDEPALHPVGAALLVHVERRRVVGGERPTVIQSASRAAASSPASRAEGSPEEIDRAGRISRTTLYGESASNRSRVSGPITSYGGDVTFASPPTRDRS